jgi:putative membrane protein
MAVLAGAGIGVILLFILLEVAANAAGLWAASQSLPGFKFKNNRVIPIAAGVYTALHILGGYVLYYIGAFLKDGLGLSWVNLGIFTGQGLLIGYLIDVLLLWATDKALKDFEITERGSLFSGAFLIIFCWGVAWYVMLIALGAAGVVDLKPIMNV